MKNEALGAVFSATQAVVVSWAAVEYPGHTRNDIPEESKQNGLAHVAKLIEEVSGEKKKHRENAEKSIQIKDLFRSPGSKDLIIQGDKVVAGNPNIIKPVIDFQKAVPEMKKHLENFPKSKNNHVGVRGPQTDKLPQRKVAPERFS